MISGKHPEQGSKGTTAAPHYHEGPTDEKGDVCLRVRFFTCRSDAGLVAGSDTSVTCTIERAASEVWPHFKDFNSWQNSYGHYYSGVVGDLEGKPLRLGGKPNEPGPHQYVVHKVIPEYLIVLDQPVWRGNYEGLSWWLGGISPGFHVFLLDERSGKTVLNVLMHHAAVMEQSSAAARMTEEEALRPWRDEAMAPEWIRKWRDDFIPTLKRRVYESRRDFGG